MEAGDSILKRDSLMESRFNTKKKGSESNEWNGDVVMNTCKSSKYSIDTSDIPVVNSSSSAPNKQ